MERRGPEFERFCRKVLQIFVAYSPIKEAITIVKQSVQFSPPGEQGEEIDLVIVMADTVLLSRPNVFSGLLSRFNLHDTARPLKGQ